MTALLDRLAAAGAGPNQPVAVAVERGVGVGFAVGAERIALAAPDPVAVVAEIERALGPRWHWWGPATPTALTADGLRVARAWDLAVVHRLLAGGWRDDPGRIWAFLHDRASATIPALGQLGLLDEPGDEGADPEDPRRPDGHLRPEWVAGAWARSPERLATWAATALAAATAQHARLEALVEHRAVPTARAESAGELLAVELAADGLPLDVATAEAIIGAEIGPRPESVAAADAARRARDDAVLTHAPLGGERDLRNPAHVRSLLRRIGVDVEDTRAWRLEQRRAEHPFVDALLTWRKAERIATTFGYDWLDAHVRDGRLRGPWSASDGAAGRMTAGAGLHNLPAELRPAVVAEPGFRFVRADLGQIEPRVLAAVSGDRALAAAAGTTDLYAPVAGRLGVARDVAKVAVLAAMYGQRSGAAGQAFRTMQTAYPVAMDYLDAADRAGQAGTSVRTYGGRLVRVGRPGDGPPDVERRAAAARGRYARNAVVQGAAAELFKVWAATVRARLAGTAAGIVLCLHDELLVHAPAADADEVAAVVGDALDEAAARWAPPGSPVRFVVDGSVVDRWADAKEASDRRADQS